MSETSRDPDVATDRVLRQALRQRPDAAPTPACPDAELLAAWLGGGLAGAAMDQARAHVADCPRCQAVVATMVRLESDAAGTAPAPVGRRWWMWAAPLAAAAAAVLIWVALPHDRGVVAPPAAQQAVLADAKSREQAAAAAPSAQEEARARSADKDQAAANRPQKLDELQKLKKEPAAAETKAAPPTVAAAAAPAAAPLPAAPGSAAADARVTERDLGRLNEGVAQRAERLIQIASPDPQIQWRVTGATIERTIDGGSTWQATPAPVTAALTAGAAPSASICWIVGRGGVVLLSTDGRTWKRLAFPDATDLSAVQATDAQAAVVTASDGRVFATSDGGTTWTKR